MVKAWREGEDKLQAIQTNTNILKTVHASLENAPQIILQLYIIFASWENEGKKSNPIPRLLEKSFNLPMRSCTYTTLRFSSELC